MEKQIVINGEDCSALFPRFGYTVAYKKIQGNAGGLMLDGSTTEDVLAIKAVITLSVMPQTEEALNAFISSLYSVPYVTVYYFDPKDGAYRTISAIVGDFDTTHQFSNVNDDNIWTMGKLTLTER